MKNCIVILEERRNIPVTNNKHENLNVYYVNKDLAVRNKIVGWLPNVVEPDPTENFKYSWKEAKNIIAKCSKRFIKNDSWSYIYYIQIL